MTAGPLSDLKVLEYSQFVSGPWCAKSLADFGAEVIKVEPPGTGDRARSIGPFPNDIPHPERSGFFLCLNTSKLGVTLDLKTSTGIKIFQQLVKEADILVENNPPALMKELGIDYESLIKINPRLIMTSITPFGQTGPYKDYKGSELISVQMGQSGYMCPLGVENTAKEPPLKLGGYQAGFTAAGTAALMTLIAVFKLNKDASGEHIDISEQEVVASQGRVWISTWFNEHTKDGRARIQRNFPQPPMPCKDGYVYTFMATEQQWQSFREMVGDRLDWVDKVYPDRWARNANWDSIEAVAKEGLSKLTKEDIVQAGKEKHFPIGPVNDAADVYNLEHLHTRGFFVNVEHPEIGKTKIPGLPYRLSQSPWRVSRPAPLLGQHNEEIFCGRLGYSKEDLVKMRQAGVI